MVIEKTLVLIKHDGVARNLIGKIISRFEETGLKLIALKMLWADESLAQKHYKIDEEWANGVFTKAKSSHEKEGKPFQYKNAMEYASLIQSWNSQFLREGPVVAIVLEGPHAIEIVRKMVGTTEPRQAAPGTIRGDFAMIESYELTNARSRVLRNLIHASDSKISADREIALWFLPSETHAYKKDLDKHY